MTSLVPTLAAYVGLALAAPAPGAAAAGQPREVVGTLDARAPSEREGVLEISAVRPSGDATLPPCLADVCQVRVDVPGFSQSFGRPHRTELFLALLDRAHIEPLATITWALVATGLRVDWSPPAFDGDPGASHGGWGSFFVRVRLRLDADNVPAIPERHAARYRLRLSG